MLRWSAAAARMIDAPCATNSLRRALSSCVQGLLAKPTMRSALVRWSKPTFCPACVGRLQQVLDQHFLNMLALRAFKGSQIGTIRTKFDAGQHHAALTLWATGLFDRKERWLGT